MLILGSTLLLLTMAFSTPPQTAGEQYALSACLCVLATAMVALRMYAVRVRGDRPGADDYCILLALVCQPMLSLHDISLTPVSGLHMGHWYRQHRRCLSWR